MRSGIARLPYGKQEIEEVRDVSPESHVIRYGSGDEPSRVSLVSQFHMAPSSYSFHPGVTGGGE
jgi:hypothetical protein